MLNIFKDGMDNLITNLKKGNIKLEIANLLTFSRLFSPFIIIPLVALNKNVAFIIMIVIFSLTDTFDGYFARKYKAITPFGEYLDAFVDKIYTGSLLFPIVLFPWIDNYLLIYVWIILLLELSISILNIYLFQNKLNPHTIFLGKIKTVILFTTIGVIYLKKFVNFSSIIILIILTFLLLLDIITLMLYFNKIKKTNES